MFDRSLGGLTHVAYRAPLTPSFIDVLGGKRKCSLAAMSVQIMWVDKCL